MRSALLVGLLVLYPGFSLAADQLAQFQSATEVEEVQRRQRLLPDDDIWWTVSGEQMRWMHLNVHQLFPTVNVYRAGQVRLLESELDQEIARFPVQTRDGQMPFAEFLEHETSTAMGVVILHRGQVVFERYPRMQPNEKPIYWSVSKVMPATLIRIMEERGRLDVSQQIQFYIPELAHSAIANISIRNILDMATGLDCGDEYQDRQSCYYQYSMAIGQRCLRPARQGQQQRRIEYLHSRLQRINYGST